MDSLSIEVNSHTPFPECAILRLKGIVHAKTLELLEKAVQDALTGSKKTLVLDLSETTYVSSGGWGAFLRSAKSVRDLGGDLFLSGMKAEVHDAFELLEYDKVLRLFPTPEQALSEGLAKPA